VVLVNCHPEQALFAQRGIWASRALCRVLCDTIIARFARFLFKQAASVYRRVEIPVEIRPFPREFSEFSQNTQVYDDFPAKNPSADERQFAVDG
jgi:hypothetical protein